jgi:cephalosporin hydroxylase
MLRRRSEYQQRLEMSGRDWLLHLFGELMEGESHWMGIRTQKNPLDVWIYQEMLHELRPQVVLEFGSAFGGSALFLAHMLELLGDGGRVVTVDHAHTEFRAEHPGIEKVSGKTQSPEVIHAVREHCQGQRTLAIHDASHEAADVLADLRTYADLVTPGSYFIVEDSTSDFLGRDRPGPFAAIEAFLSERDDFERDPGRERFLLSYNFGGFLRRKH